MIRIQFLYLLLCILVLTTACRKDQTQSTIIDIDPIETIQQIESTIIGRIINDNGEALSEVSLTMGSTSVFSNIHGDFIISDFVNEKRALIHVQKEGYFDAFPVFNPSDKGKISINVHLKEKTSSQTLNTNQGGNLALSDDFNIEFQANSLSSTPTIEVSGYYIDPTDSDASKTMPGNLSGLTTDNEEVRIISYGIGRFEFEETEEATLTQAVTINIAIPPSLSNNAPTSLSLWHFDKTEGIWVEKGIAQRQGNFYIGEVFQSGIWTTAIPADIIKLEGRLLHSLSEASLQFRISRTSDDASGNYSADINGYFSGFVFKDELLLLEVLNACGEIISQENLGPFSSDTEAGDIAISIPSENQLNIQGNLLDCAVDPIHGGFVSCVVNGAVHILTTDEEGRFQASILVCDETDEINIYGFDDEIIGESIAYSQDYVTSMVIFACDTTVNFGSGYYITTESIVWKLDTTILLQEPYSQGNDKFVFEFSIPSPFIPGANIQFEAICTNEVPTDVYLIEEIMITEMHDDVINSENTISPPIGSASIIYNTLIFTGLFAASIEDLPLHTMIEGDDFTQVVYGKLFALSHF